ncbi:MAG: type 1 glutamine amidotransferase domain-containing protein [Bryobacteraceae bacterium]
MSENLKGKRVAILATDGVEQVELLEPKKALEAAGATTDVISPKGGKIKGWNHTDWGQEIPVDVNLKSASVNNYDALMLPGGVMNPDHLRTEPAAVQFVKSFLDSGKPVAAICHGPWLLVEADVVRGRKLTSWPSLRTDITNAGGEWTDQEVVTDHGLVTSRKPADIPAFNRKMIEEFAEGKHAPQQTYASAR